VVDIGERPTQRGRLGIAGPDIREAAQLGGQGGIADHQPPAGDRGRGVGKRRCFPHDLMGPVIERAAGRRMRVRRIAVAFRRRNFCGGEPVVGVVPGGGGDLWVWFGRMRSLRRVGGAHPVEVGAEGDGVVAVALQRPNAGVLGSVLGAVQGFQDGLGEQGWALISMKVWWSVPALVMACWKRTGLRMLVAQWSASKTGRVSRFS